MPGGDLEKEIRRRNFFRRDKNGLNRIKQLLALTAFFIQILHDIGIEHMDMAWNNLLEELNCTLRMTDFGLSLPRELAIEKKINRDWTDYSIMVGEIIGSHFGLTHLGELNDACPDAHELITFAQDLDIYYEEGLERKRIMHDFNSL